MIMNNIELASTYVPLLDEVYTAASVTSTLDGSPEIARAGSNAGEMVVPKLEMQGLGNYSRNEGYVNGDVTLTNETVKADYDRGRMFTVDAMDDIETAGLAFGRLSGEFIRTKVGPEIDAYRLAKYASTDGVSTAEGELADGKAYLTAIQTAWAKMSEDEVPETDRALFISPTALTLIQGLDTYVSKAVLDQFAAIHTVPASRLVSKVKLRDGKTGGQEAGGYEKAEDAVAVHFIIIHRPAVCQFTKHLAPKVVSASDNQNADAWKFGYRIVGVAQVYDNKKAGIYVHKAQASEAV